MKTWSMYEVYTQLGESRTTVQGWAVDIMKKPKGSSGIAWTFTEEEVETLWRIKLFKKLGYSNAVVQQELLKSDKHKAESLQHQIDKLIEKRDELDQLISIAYTLKETGLGPHTLRFEIPGMETLSFSHAIRLLSLSRDIDAEGFGGFDFIGTEEFGDVYLSPWEPIEELRNLGSKPTDEAVQHLIETQFDLFRKFSSPSVLMFSGFSFLFSPNSKFGSSLAEEIGKEFLDFYVTAVKCYCEAHKDNEYDSIPGIALEAIHKLGQQKYAAGSTEVQAQIKRIHGYIVGIGYKTLQSQLRVLKMLNLSVSPGGYNRTADGKIKKDFVWFLTRAIDIYCQSFDQIEDGGNL